MADYALSLRDPDETLTIGLSSLPDKGTWFDLPGGAVQVDDVRWIGSEPVIFAVRVIPADREHLNPKKQRRALTRDY